MTKEQAIKVLRPILDTYVDHANIAMTVEADNDAEALEMAFEALKQPEIIRCSDCTHFREERDGEMWCGISNGHSIDKNFFCGDAERRTDG